MSSVQDFAVFTQVLVALPYKACLSGSSGDPSGVACGLLLGEENEVQKLSDLLVNLQQLQYCSSAIETQIVVYSKD